MNDADKKVLSEVMDMFQKQAVVTKQKPKKSGLSFKLGNAENQSSPLPPVNEQKCTELPGEGDDLFKKLAVEKPIQKKSGLSLKLGNVAGGVSTEIAATKEEISAVGTENVDNKQDESSLPVE